MPRLPPMAAALGFAAALSAAAGEPAVARYNLVVVGPDRDSANTVALEAERAAERFHRAFGLPLAEPSPGPVVVVHLDAPGAREDGEGALAAQAPEGPAKLRLLWGPPPLRRDALARGVARALALRQVIGSGKRGSDALPPWVLDGVASFAEPPGVADEEGARAALLARLAPRLGLDGAFGLLGGRALSPETRRGLAGALLAAAAATPAARTRLLEALPAFAVDPAAALAGVAGRADVEAWWADWWRGQAANLPPLRLGARPTHLWILAWEKDDEGPLPPEAGVAQVASPWFGPWFASPPSVDLAALAALRSAIAGRRAEALAWFDGVASPGYATAGEWLSDGFRAAGADPAPEGGPALGWFRALPQPPRAPSPRAGARGPSAKD